MKDPITLTHVQIYLEHTSTTLSEQNLPQTLVSQNAPTSKTNIRPSTEKKLSMAANSALARKVREPLRPIRAFGAQTFKFKLARNHGRAQSLRRIRGRRLCSSSASILLTRARTICLPRVRSQCCLLKLCCFECCALKKLEFEDLVFWGLIIRELFSVSRVVCWRVIFETLITSDVLFEELSACFMILCCFKSAIFKYYN